MGVEIRIWQLPVLQAHATSALPHGAVFTQGELPGGKKASVVQADVTDSASIEAMVRSTRVLITTVGPFDKYGECVVKACAEAGTDYADITGETWWVECMQAKYAEAASSSGAVLVPMCGVDSVPSDVTAMLAARHATQQLGTGVSVGHAYFTGMGGVSGGTIHSLLGALEAPDKGKLAAHPWVCARMDLPAPASCAPTTGIGGGARPPARTAATPPVRASPASFLAPMTEMQSVAADFPLFPVWDAEAGVYKAPFIMAPVNTRVVRRSAVLHGMAGIPYSVAVTPSSPQAQPYLYTEHMPCANWFLALGMCWLTALGGLLLAFPLTRSLLLPFLASPGQGPSPSTLQSGWHRVVHVATPTDPDQQDQRIVAAIQGGEPGYTATSAMLATCGILLATQRDTLPATLVHGGGFLTPAAAFGVALPKALAQRGDFGVYVDTVPRSELQAKLAPLLSSTKQAPGAELVEPGVARGQVEW